MQLTSDKCTLVNLFLSSSPLSLACSVEWRGTSMAGVLMLALAVISISLSINSTHPALHMYTRSQLGYNYTNLKRGIPRVTFISPRPAKWNVFRVIWVEGSPIDCAEFNTLTIHHNYRLHTHPRKSYRIANKAQNSWTNIWLSMLRINGQTSL